MDDKSYEKFKELYQAFITNNTPQDSLSLLLKCLQFIFNRGYWSISSKRVTQFVEGDTTYSWIIDQRFVNITVAMYIKELHKARVKAISLTRERVYKLITSVEGIISSPDRKKK